LDRIAHRSLIIVSFWSGINSRDVKKEKLRIRWISSLKKNVHVRLQVGPSGESVIDEGLEKRLRAEEGSSFRGKGY